MFERFLGYGGHASRSASDDQARVQYFVLGASFDALRVLLAPNFFHIFVAEAERSDFLDQERLTALVQQQQQCSRGRQQCVRDDDDNDDDFFFFFGASGSGC